MDTRATARRARKKILFAQRFLRPDGGGATVAAWMLEALKQDYDITIAAWEPVDFAAVDRFCGTTLRESSFPVVLPPAPMRHLGNLVSALDPDPFSCQSWSMMMAWVKRRAADYDLVLSALDEVDFGVRAVQYIHFPYMRAQYHPPNCSNGASALGRAKRAIDRVRPWRIVSGFSYERMKSNITLTNSNWTASHICNAYGIGARTVYPPVVMTNSEIPWEERKNSLVCVGRLALAKRLDIIIETVSRVRRRHPDFQLHIVGAKDSTPGHKETYAYLQERAHSCSDWLFLHENLSRTDLVKEVKKHRYGMHAMVDEHFGIAVAELVRAGCIVLVHDSGGPVEIVGRDNRLLYKTTDEAAEKLAALLDNPPRRESVRQGLLGQQGKFSETTFVREIRSLVDEQFVD